MTLNTARQIFWRTKTRKAYRESGGSLRQAIRVKRGGHDAKKRRDRKRKER